nr:MAG TPA: hypothetical protein [Caudoviricetes sp.]
MAIKERKQITGTAAQIKKYAGHNGVLAYATDTKHLHVLSGVAGQTTELANRSDIPAPQDISGKADKTYVDQQLATKQPKGDYATQDDLRNNSIDISESTADYNVEDIVQEDQYKVVEIISHETGSFRVMDASEPPKHFIKRTGFRDVLAGYEFPHEESTVIVEKYLADSSTTSGSVSVINGDSSSTWTKVVYMTGGVVNIDGANWKWAGGTAPTLKFPGVLVCHWNKTGGIANYVAGAS